MNRIRKTLCSATALAIVGACTHERAGPADAGPPRVHIVDHGAPPDAQTTCGGLVCIEPILGSPLDEMACCLPSLACGVQSPVLGNRCLEPAKRGGVDPSCPSVTAPNGATAAGCCTPSGRCGLFDRFGPLGCALVDETDAGARCHFDPTVSCRSLVSVPCDGPEDCPTGQSCCGRLSFGVYDAFGCFPSCGVAESADRGVWDELCHAGADCRAPGNACAAVAAFPESSGRCVARSAPDGGPEREAGRADGGPPPPRPQPRPRPRDGGPRPRDGSVGGKVTDALDGLDGSASRGAVGVACGSVQCSAGEPCCRREPWEPYCVPRGETCACAGPRPRDASDARDASGD